MGQKQQENFIQWRLAIGEWLIFKALDIMPRDHVDTRIWTRCVFKACDILRARLAITDPEYKGG